MDSDNVNIYMNSHTDNNDSVIQTTFETPLFFENETECAILDLKLLNLSAKKIYTIDDKWFLRYTMLKLDDQVINNLVIKSDGDNSLVDKTEIYDLRFSYMTTKDIYVNIKKIVQFTNEQAVLLVNKKYNNAIRLNFDLTQDIVTRDYIIEPIILFEKTNEEELHVQRILGRIKIRKYTDDPYTQEYIDVFHYIIDFNNMDFMKMIKYPLEKWFPKTAKSAQPLKLTHVDIPTIVYLHCDVVKNSYLAVKKTDVIQVIYYKSEKHVYDIQYPLYIPIKNKEISSIRIQFRDESGNPIPIKNGFISILLSFRPIQRKILF